MIFFIHLDDLGLPGHFHCPQHIMFVMRDKWVRYRVSLRGKTGISAKLNPNFSQIILDPVDLRIVHGCCCQSKKRGICPPQSGLVQRNAVKSSGFCALNPIIFIGFFLWIPIKKFKKIGPICRHWAIVSCCIRWATKCAFLQCTNGMPGRARVHL